MVISLKSSLIIHVVAMKCLTGLPLLIHIEILWRSRRFKNWGVAVGSFVYRLHSPVYISSFNLLSHSYAVFFTVHTWETSSFFCDMVTRWPMYATSVTAFLVIGVLDFHFTHIHIRPKYFPEHFVSNTCKSHSCAQHEPPSQHHTEQTPQSLINLLCTIWKNIHRDGHVRSSSVRLHLPAR
jgi:hypothetical protein